MAGNKKQKSKGKPQPKVAKKIKQVVKEVERPKPSIGRGIAKGIGGLLGGLVGLSDAGKSAGDFVADITGMGAYKVNSNTFMKGSDVVPEFRHLSDGSVIVSHREFVMDVPSSTGFNLNSWVVNPTNYSLFPFLSTIAAAYEEYEFLGLVFVYKKTSGSAINGTNPALGTTIMATEYDLSKPLFKAKQDMEAYEFSCSAAADQELLHPVECNPKRDVLNSRYTNNGPRLNAASTDQQSVTFNAETLLVNNLTDIGRFQIATVGNPASGNIVGELWNTYHIKFSKPRYVSLGFRGGYYHSTSGSSGATASNSSIFGSATTRKVLSDSNTNYASVSIESSSTIRIGGLPAGEKFGVIVAAHAAGAITWAASTTFAGCTQDAGFFNTGTGGQPVAVSSADLSGFTAVYMTAAIVNSGTTPNASVTLTFNNPVVTAGSVNFDYDVQVFSLPNVLTTTTTVLSAPLADVLGPKIAQLEDQFRQLTLENQYLRQQVCQVVDDVKGGKEEDFDVVVPSVHPPNRFTLPPLSRILRLPPAPHQQDQPLPKPTGVG